MKLKNESGRSMVEMLGVLAIIGVLSVGGIAGYKMAMRKHRANEFMKDFQIIMLESSNWARTLPGRSVSSGDDTFLCGKGSSFKIGNNTNTFTAGNVLFNSSDGNYIMENDGKLDGSHLGDYIQCTADGSKNPNVDWNFLKDLQVEGTPIIEIEIFTMDGKLYGMYNYSNYKEKNMPSSFDDIKIDYIDFKFNRDLSIE